VSLPLSLRSAAWRRLALPGTLVVLDFDGTLARIVRDRAAARLSPRTRAALARVAARYPVAILSGRASADVSSRLDGVRVAWVVGSHGAEWPGEAVGRRAWRGQVAAWKRALAPRLRGLSGVEIEDKRLSLAIHWRAAPDPARAAALVARAAAGLDGASPIAGKRVLNLVPAGAGDKGAALRRLAAEAGAARILFVGDDVTDEAAFRVPLPVPSVTVRVGQDAGSGARYHVRGRGEVDRLLASLAGMRAPDGRDGAAGQRRGRAGSRARGLGL
jgi:trehalose 6-phosphate phosphatase